MNNLKKKHRCGLGVAENTFTRNIQQADDSYIIASPQSQLQSITTDCEQTIAARGLMMSKKKFHWYTNITRVGHKQLMCSQGGVSYGEELYVLSIYIPLTGDLTTETIYRTNKGWASFCEFKAQLTNPGARITYRIRLLNCIGVQSITCGMETGGVLSGQVALDVHVYLLALTFLLKCILCGLVEHASA